jgi:hypothetical protein
LAARWSGERGGCRGGREVFAGVLVGEKILVINGSGANIDKLYYLPTLVGNAACNGRISMGFSAPHPLRVHMNVVGSFPQPSRCSRRGGPLFPYPHQKDDGGKKKRDPSVKFQRSEYASMMEGVKFFQPF